MELTNELKARFFALYYGQHIALITGERHLTEIYDPSEQEIKAIELRPLSSITEEEAKDFMQYWYNERPTMECRTLVIEWWSHNTHTTASDWLRAKGFALPFMGRPSEQWIEWGVVKLKEA